MFSSFEWRVFALAGLPADWPWILLSVGAAFAGGMWTGSRLARRRPRQKDLDGTIAARIDHEFRTPLSVIIGSAELLGDDTGGDLDDERRRLVEAIQRAARRLHRMVEDLTLVGQIQTGWFAPKREPVSLAQVADEVAEWNRVDASTKGVGLTVEVRDPAWIRGDPVRLRQMVDNLVTNAVKFTPPGGSVSIVVRRDPGGSLEVEVTDTGVGIRPEDRYRIFRRFERGAHAVANHVPGPGVGLSVVEAVASAHGGRVRVDSSPAGSRFVVQLPAAAVENQVDEVHP